MTTEKHAEITAEVWRFVHSIDDNKTMCAGLDGPHSYWCNKVSQVVADFLAAREKATRISEVRHIQHSFDQKVLKAKKDDKSSGAYWFKITIDECADDLEGVLNATEADRADAPSEQPPSEPSDRERARRPIDKNLVVKANREGRYFVTLLDPSGDHLFSAPDWGWYEGTVQHRDQMVERIAELYAAEFATVRAGQVRLTAEDVLRMLEFGKTQIDRMDYCERLAEKANAILASKQSGDTPQAAWKRLREKCASFVEINAHYLQGTGSVGVPMANHIRALAYEPPRGNQ